MHSGRAAVVAHRPPYGCAGAGGVGGGGGGRGPGGDGDGAGPQPEGRVSLYLEYNVPAAFVGNERQHVSTSAHQRTPTRTQTRTQT